MHYSPKSGKGTSTVAPCKATKIQETTTGNIVSMSQGRQVRQAGTSSGVHRRRHPQNDRSGVIVTMPTTRPTRLHQGRQARSRGPRSVRSHQAEQTSASGIAVPRGLGEHGGLVDPHPRSRDNRAHAPDRPSQMQQSGRNQGQQPSGCYNGMWKKELDVNVVLSCISREGGEEAA